MEGVQDMIALSSESFHSTMADNRYVACILHHGPFADIAPEARAVMAESGDPWTWTRLDLSESPEIAAMFGLSAAEPSLLLMREQVVLYCEPLAAASPEATQKYLERAARLDMSKVRSAVATERESQQSLFARRVCPTALRSR